MHTYSGVKFDYMQPTKDMVVIEDIAHALSNLCRFNGHTQHFYSVAQHSMLVSRLVPPSLALAGLLHDAAEAYIGDIVSPFKRKHPGIARDERNIWIAIAMKFDIPVTIAPEVKHADLVALATEARDLLGPAPELWEELPEPDQVFIYPDPPEEAEVRFLNLFKYLTEGM